MKNHGEHPDYEYENWRILLDDSREDTCGCSLAGWDWYRGVAIPLGWIVAACLWVWWWAALGWEVGLWIA